MISFVIPAYDEERLIGGTIDALHAAGAALGEAYEIVVVDDASSDATADIARAHGARLVRVALRHIAATRNAGARAASGELLVFVDADTLVPPDTARAAVDAMRQGAVGGGAPLRFDGAVPLSVRVLTAVAMAAFRALGRAAGCFIFCTRAAFDAIGGFDEAYFGAEDLVMSRALKRHGRFVVLRTPVITSGRKIRTHRARDMLRVLARLAFQGPRVIKQRRGMELWYGERQHDVDAAEKDRPSRFGRKPFR